MNDSYRKGMRVLALAIALVMLLGVPGSVRAAKADASDYYLVGMMNGWDVDEAYKLSPNPGADGEYWITLDLAAGAEFKVTNGDKSAWYPGGSNNNYVVSEAGSYTVYFRPAGNSDWANGFFYVAKNEILLFDSADIVTVSGDTPLPETGE